MDGWGMPLPTESSPRGFRLRIADCRLRIVSLRKTMHQRVRQPATVCNGMIDTLGWLNAVMLAHEVARELTALQVFLEECGIATGRWTVAAGARCLNRHDRGRRDFERRRLDRKLFMPGVIVDDLNLACATRSTAKQTPGRVNGTLTLAAEGYVMAQPPELPAEPETP